jgi:hypothetical protein
LGEAPEYAEAIQPGGVDLVPMGIVGTDGRPRKDLLFRKYLLQPAQESAAARALGVEKREQRIRIAPSSRISGL